MHEIRNDRPTDPRGKVSPGREREPRRFLGWIATALATADAGARASSSEPATPDPSVVVREPVPDHPKRPERREILRALMDATGGIDDEPAPVAAVAARGPAPVATGDASGQPETTVHLASYRFVPHLVQGWKRLVKRHPEFLMGLKARDATVELGPGKGTFHRLIAGPLPSRDFARRLCRSLRDRGVYCAIVPFTGWRLGEIEAHREG